MQNAKSWFQSGTIWTAITAIVGAIAGYFNHQISIWELIIAIVTALSVIRGRTATTDIRGRNVLGITDSQAPK